MLLHQPAQEAVVVAFAVPKSSAEGVEGDSRHDDQIDVWEGRGEGKIRFKVKLWLGDAPGVLGEAIDGLHRLEGNHDEILRVLPNDLGDEDFLLQRKGALEKISRLDLFRHGEIDCDGGGRGVLRGANHSGYTGFGGAFDVGGLKKTKLFSHRLTQ